ncbi:MAG TPA: DNA-directed RNA polymerase subunit beta [Clostridia bacterium]|nr:DNA-directed RNA polymerase subunit beta [Clostridia bacterium]
MSESMRKIMCGKTERVTFSRIKHNCEMPNLIEVQKDSYKEFIEKGIEKVFNDFSPITDYSAKMELEFLEPNLDGVCKYTTKECKERDATYTSPLKVKVRLTVKDTGKMIEQTVFMGDIPRMTEEGTFIINGAERVVVSQLVRSPGVYTKSNLDKNDITRYHTTVIPNRGAWLEFEQDPTGTLSVRVDKTRKMNATVLLRALGFGTDQELYDLFDNDPMIAATIAKDGDIDNTTIAKVELYRKLKPGEVPTQSGVDALLHNIFFEARRYDISHVGRYKFNKKLSVANRIEGLMLARPAIDEMGEIIAEADGQALSRETALAIQDAGINVVYLKCSDEYAKKNGEAEIKIIGNNTVDLTSYIDCSPKELGITEKVYYPTLKSLMEDFGNDMEALKQAIVAQKDQLIYKHITTDDIVASVNYNINMKYGFWEVDNIDHLANRRVRSVGELLQNYFRIGMARLEKNIREKMATVQDPNEITPQSLINIRPISSAIREFFGSSQLSQFMDQPNPIAELTHKRKLSALGPGGLNRERAGIEVRDVHYTHYGRMCPIETPEGQNIGLITSLSSYAKINEYGFIETPYFKVIKGTGKVTSEAHYFDADEEDKYIVAQANEPVDDNNKLVNKRVTCRYRDKIKEYPVEEIEYMDVDPKQLVSVATSLIPFLENDDANRALMGSNMQRQAVPLLRPQAPIVGTGMEYKVAHDSGVCVIAKESGTVKFVSADEIIIVNDSDGEEEVYELRKFRRSNQCTCINQKPIVSKGEKVAEGDIIADGPATENGELALGRNILIGFMTWEGYNYEDAILISEDLVKEDVFTTIHIEKYELEARDTKLGKEIITRDIPNVSDDLLKNLDENGIIRIGAEVKSGDYLVGKVTPKGETELTPEERLLRAIFGEKARDVRDVSLKVPHGENGTIVDVNIFTREDKDELDPGVNQLVRVYIAQKRKISVGDKMAGRHGNKGVISRVLPREDMPFMADGTPLQIVLNPLGVPSRMNIGQVLEVHLGMVAKMLDWKVATPVFDGAKEEDIVKLYDENGISTDGKWQLYDGRTGEPFEHKITVGYMYMLKLIHLVDDKIHARSVGPYSLVTQQPLGGKAQFGGQRFGEMEVWALEAYGASHILQEVLTVKSDDVMGRNKIFHSIINANVTSEPGIPEAFRVLRREIQALGLDIKLSDNGEEVILPDSYEDERDYEPVIKKEEALKEISLDSMEDIGSFESMFSGGIDTVSEDDDISEDIITDGDQDLLKGLFNLEDSMDTFGDSVGLLDDDAEDDDLSPEKFSREMGLDKLDTDDILSKAFGNDDDLI